MTTEFNFTFGNYPSKVTIQDDLPTAGEIGLGDTPALMVADTGTEPIARRISHNSGIPLLVLESGENAKTWDSVEKILRQGRAAGLGRDGLFIGVGGGVVGDLTAFAASVYMRGARLCLVSTTLLGMVDASLGGKTGIDLLGLKNLVGSFFPAGRVLIPMAALDTLPESEWKSGMAELIKTAVLDSGYFFRQAKELAALKKGGRDSPAYRTCLKECISLAVAYKGRIVEADPRETGKQRPLLNLGHTFGHALEGAAGLGKISHGEAVAWGMARACELGVALGITPKTRAAEIMELLKLYGYETRAPHPLAKSPDPIMDAMGADKKQVAGSLRFIVPDESGARIVTPADTPSPQANGGARLIRSIIQGERPL